MDKEINISVSVIIRRAESNHLWGNTTYCAVEVVVNPVEMEPWTILKKEPNKIHYHGGVADLVLHYKEAEAYKFNMESSEPSLFVVMRETDQDENKDTDMPVNILLVSASPYEAQDYDDVNDIVDRVPIPSTLYSLIVEFINDHYKEEKFIKRKRDKIKIEELKFGKEPIFQKQTHIKN